MISVINSTSTDLLIIFTRFPQPGKTKTRLSRVMGNEAAAACQRQMTEHMVAQSRELARHRAVDLQIHYDGATLAEMTAWLGSDMTYHLQAAGDMGRRLAASFSFGFQGKRSKIILAGADCPSVSPALLGAAFAAMPQADLVIGPALDGGYYLIGMHGPHPELFVKIDWGTARVLPQTMDKAASLKLIIRQMDPLHDIDRPEDLKYFRHYTGP